MIKNRLQEYNNREERNKFISEVLHLYLGNSVLNIGGGGEKHLKKYLPEYIDYQELDIAGKPEASGYHRLWPDQASGFRPAALCGGSGVVL